MNRKLLVMAVIGLAALLVMAGAMAADKNDSRDRQQTQRNPAGGSHARVMINGKENPALSRVAVKQGTHVMVPDKTFFQETGGQVQQREGWVSPHSVHPDEDRQQRWYVTQRNGRELRYREGDRQYYYGGVPHYWSVAPYQSENGLYLSLGDLSLTLGGGYTYQDYYGGPQVTLCEGGYCPAPGESRFIYPYEGAYYGHQVAVQGYAAPGSLVRIQVLEDMPFPFKKNVVYNQTMRANGSGLVSVSVWVQNSGAYESYFDLLNDYGNLLSRQTHRFYVR